MGKSQLGIWVSVRVNPPGKGGFALQEGFNRRKINNNKRNHHLFHFIPGGTHNKNSASLIYTKHPIPPAHQNLPPPPLPVYQVFIHFWVYKIKTCPSLCVTKWETTLAFLYLSSDTLSVQCSIEHWKL